MRAGSLRERVKKDEEDEEEEKRRTVG